MSNLTTVWRAVRPLVEYRLTAAELEALEIKASGLISLREYWHYENMIRFVR